MRKILSIDFDIIMYPCIKLYNDKVGGEANPTQLWEYLAAEHDIQEFICYDAKTLLMLATLIKTAVDKGAKLHLITEHQEIVDQLKKDENYDEETFTIHNIDFHHDIWYRPDDKNLLVTFEDYNCSNWLGLLYLHNKTEAIHWIKAANSAMFGDPDYNASDIFTSITNLNDFMDNTDFQFDDIYFCLSPQWVPYKFHHLYSLISTLVTMEVNANDEYCNECE